MDYSSRSLSEQTTQIAAAILDRRQNDPLELFEPFGPQRLFIEAVLGRKHRENYYIGANRSGKSDAGAYAGAHLARFGYENTGWSYGRHGTETVAVRDRATSGWVSAIDYPTCRDTIQPKYFDNGYVPPNSTHEPFIPPHEIEHWHSSENVLKLRNGSIIGFKSADSGRLKYQGAEKDWVHLDEEHPETIFDEITIRVGAKPLIIFTTCTLLPPEGIVGGITWLFNKVIKPWQHGKLDRVGVYNASIYDNPHIDRREIEALEARWPEGSIQRRIRLAGELIGGLAGARVYSGFDHRLNVRPQGEIIQRRPLAWIWDFNVEPMVSLIGQRKHETFHIFKELLLEEGNIDEMCEFFRSFHPKHLAEIWVYGDASGHSRTAQTKMSSYQIILNSMIGYPVPLRLKVPDKNPSVTARVNAVNQICRSTEGVASLEIDPSCEELINDLEQVIGDGKQGIKKTFNKKDPYFRRTHMSDALGYWINMERPVQQINEHQGGRAPRVKTPAYGRRHRG
jgi:phage terminase large subunit-like protein|tara:strand:+ start:992 stop:2518 length:1527 start_codon:yes stop_codon:yes gene_type:complete